MKMASIKQAMVLLGISVVFAFVAVIIALSGRQAKPGGKTGTEIMFYYPAQAGGSLSRSMEHIVNDFNKTNGKGITVTPVYCGTYKQTAQKAMSDIAARNGPNVVLSGMLDIGDYYGVGAVADISPYIRAEGADWQNDFIEGFWGNFVIADEQNPQGGIYGLPFQHSVCVLFYNIDMLEAVGVSAPPSTAKEMLETVAALSGRQGNFVPLEFPADVWILENLVLSGGETLSQGNKPRFNTATAVASLEFLSQLIAGGAMVQSWAGAAEDFAAESCAMMFNTTGNIGFVSKAASFRWGIATLPASGSPALSGGGGGLIMLAAQSPQQQTASWEFMKYMTSPQTTARWLEASGYFAVRKSAGELAPVQQYYAAHPQAAQAAALLEHARPQWSSAKYWDVYALMQVALDNVLIGRKTGAVQALDAAQNAAGILLK